MINNLLPPGAMVKATSKGPSQGWEGTGPTGQQFPEGERCTCSEARGCWDGEQGRDTPR